MMTKEMTRLVLLQIAGFAAIFATLSPRIRGGIAFIQSITTPNVWDQVWQLATGEGSLAPGPRYGAAQAESPADADPFMFLDNIAEKTGK